MPVPTAFTPWLAVASWLTAGACLLPAAGAAPAEFSVEAAPLDGETTAGTLLGLVGEQVRINGEQGEVHVAFADLAELRFPAPAAPPETPDSAALLRGGSELPVSTVTLEDGSFIAAVPGLGAVSLPGRAVRAIRFRPLAGADAERWEELAASEPEGDLVVVRRGARLDKLVGSVGGVGEEVVTFLLNGSEVPLPRGRTNFIGVVFGGAPVATKPVAIVRPHVGGALRAATLASDADGGLAITLVDGASLTVPLSGVASIDFAAGSVTPLADLPTRGNSDVTAGWADEPWPVGRNRNLEGGPIRLAGRTFDRGLTLHAPATLQWRLPKGIGRLRATVGIEDARRSLGVGEVDLTVSGDGRELFKQRLTHADPPVEMNLDLTGVRTLIIAVGVGDDPFAGDHLALGNARVTR